MLNEIPKWVDDPLLVRDEAKSTLRVSLEWLAVAATLLVPVAWLSLVEKLWVVCVWIVLCIVVVAAVCGSAFIGEMANGTRFRRGTYRLRRIGVLALLPVVFVVYNLIFN